MFKRVGLYLLVNLLVLTTISITASIAMSLLGFRGYMTSTGLDYQALMIFCLVWGMAGSFISLAISRVSAKAMLGVKLIDPSRDAENAWLHQMVSNLAKSAGLPRTPEVGIYKSADVNAFATGPTKSRALVAFSSGLLSSMDRQKVEGVAAHEIAHIQNGDMVTLALIQGVINAFVMFFARVIAFAVSQSVKEEYRSIVNLAVVVILDILLSLLAMLAVNWFSHRREFRADAGSKALSSREKMKSALEFLAGLHPCPEAHASIAAYKISGRSRRGLARYFSTHPPIEERIAALDRLP